ncbi:MAG: hypothetical protein K9I82_09265 [Chitinophagaceae bacterium]|nr:hypothetical protein [Chitinophagaceae bacterium]
MLKSIFTVVLFFSIINCIAQTTKPKPSNNTIKIAKATGSLITSEDAEKVLLHHNKVRAEVGVDKLVWSNEIAAYAQEWANYLVSENNCKMMHRSSANRNDKNWGENLFWGSSATYYKPLDASKGWAGEKADYTYAPCCGDNFMKIGHYTQMVWKNSKEMGLGIATCPTGEVIIVANYNPSGNYVGQYPY